MLLAITAVGVVLEAGMPDEKEPFLEPRDTRKMQSPA